MFILNRKSGMTQECTNEDVIRQLSKDDGYIVAETPEACLAALNAKPCSEEPVEAVSEAKAEETKANDEPAEKPSREELTAMKVKELRNVAKDLGIQNYSNMDKATLVEVILAY